jgi:hypothetical protein
MWKTISRSSWAKYCCGDQTGWQNRIGWIREILVTKKIMKKNLSYCSLNKKTFELKIKEIRMKQNFEIF